MKQIANQYKQEDVALPVLAFPYDENPSSDEHLIGEILMCYPQVVLLAAERNKRVEDMITQLIEHGIRNILK
jgi:ssRNA-specific RNase YbeY (16S rRNA maturation enzyme)